MAFHSVVNNAFIESKVLPALKALDQDPEIGPLSFAMLEPARFTRGYRALVLASKSLDDLGGRDAILKVYLALEKGDLLARNAVEVISVLRTNSWEIRALSQALPVPELGTAYQVGGSEIESMDLKEPVFLLSRPLPKAA